MLVRRRRLAHVHVQAAEAGMVRHVGLLRHHRGPVAAVTTVASPAATSSFAVAPAAAAAEAAS